ncbi:MAG TPA: N-acetylmuramoyl-L-alanine amidase [Chloroflexota bacterium]
MRLGRCLVVAGSLLALLAAPALAASVDSLCAPRGARCDDYPALAGAIDAELLPVPNGQPGPLVMPAGGWSQFGRPQPATPVWNPPGPKRVGLQAGHYLFDEAPPELLGLRRNPGAPGGGRIEWQVTIDLVERAAEILRGGGVEVDVLPTTIPIRYRAHAFLAVHVDGEASGRLRGYKVARPNFSSIPEVDDAFAQTIYEEYGRATGLPDNSEYITGRMRNYYAFNARRYQHAVAPGVPQAIIETGFMSNWADRDFLFNRPEAAAQGIADAMLRFLAADLY